MKDLPANFGLRRLKATLEHFPGRRIAIDAGAHRGIWTQVMMMEFERVYSFEPVLDNYQYLQAINPWSIRIALGDKLGRCSMASGENTGQYHIDTLDGEITLRPLDDWEFTDVDFIKIDVEGYEHQVISGAIETIGQSHPAILLEDNGLCQRYDISSGDIVNLMEQLGYQNVARFQDDYLWLHE